MSAVQIRITSTEFTETNFGWFEVYADRTLLLLADVVDDAEFNLISFSNLFLHANVAVGDTWNYWVRAAYLDRSSGAITYGTLKSLGDITITGTLGDVPPGGLAGQVLKKNSSADFDYDWADDELGSGISDGGGGGGFDPGTPPVIVQSKAASAASASITLDSAPTDGNLLIAFTTNPTTASAGSGWTIIFQQSNGTDWTTWLKKTAGAGESATQTPIGSAPSNAGIIMWELSGAAATPEVLWAITTPLTATMNQSAQYPGMTDKLALGGVMAVSGSVTITNTYNMTQDQLVNTGNRRLFGGHSDGATPIAQIIARFSGSVESKCGVLVLTA